MEHSEIAAPGAYGVAVLERHEAGDLVQMGEVMPGPGGKQVGESHHAEGRVAAAPFEVLRLQIQSTQRVQVGGAETGKLIQHRLDGLAVALAQVRPKIEGLKGLRLASFKDDPGARHSVGAFGVNQVADDLERAPGVFAFMAEDAAIETLLQAAVEAFSKRRMPRVEACWCWARSTACLRTRASRTTCAACARRHKLIQQRLPLGVAVGELPAGLDPSALTSFYTTVVDGLAIQARDGAPRKELRFAAACAMAAWDQVVVELGA